MLGIYRPSASAAVVFVGALLCASVSRPEPAATGLPTVGVPLHVPLVPFTVKSYGGDDLVLRWKGDDYVVPARYVKGDLPEGKKASIIGDKANAFTAEALLPDMTPPTGGDLAEFNGKLGWNRQVHALVQFDHPASKDLFWVEMVTHDREGCGRTKPVHPCVDQDSDFESFGLDVFVHRRFDFERFYASKDRKRVFMCETGSPLHVPFWPSCTLFSSPYPDITTTCSFPFGFMSEWVVISKWCGDVAGVKK